MTLQVRVRVIQATDFCFQRFVILHLQEFLSIIISCLSCLLCDLVTALNNEEGTCECNSVQLLKIYSRIMY